MTVQAGTWIALQHRERISEYDVSRRDEYGYRGTRRYRFRLYVQFRNVPKDVLIWVTTRDVRPGTTQHSDVSPLVRSSPSPMPMAAGHCLPLSHRSSV